MDISDFVQWAGGSAALVWAFRQGTEAFASLVKAKAAKEAAEAAQDVAGAKAFEDALERVERLEARVQELEEALARSEDDRRHLQGQVAVLGQELDVERRARLAAESREHALARELTQLRLDIRGGHTQLPTPIRPPAKP